MAHKRKKDIVTIRLSCGHERTWNATMPKNNYGSNDTVTCQRCGHKEKVLALYNKMKKERKEWNVNEN